MSGAYNNSISHAVLTGCVNINRPYCLCQCLGSLTESSSTEFNLAGKRGKETGCLAWKDESQLPLYSQLTVGQWASTKLSVFWCYEVSLVNGVWRREGRGVRALRKEALIMINSLGEAPMTSHFLHCYLSLSGYQSPRKEYGRRREIIKKKVIPLQIVPTLFNSCVL